VSSALTFSSYAQTLASRKLGLDSCFHATDDRQVIRDEVFALLVDHPLRVDVTLLEKSKAKRILEPASRRSWGCVVGRGPRAYSRAPPAVACDGYPVCPLTN
jgi:hypothetical protein